MPETIFILPKFKESFLKLTALEARGEYSRGQGIRK